MSVFGSIMSSIFGHGAKAQPPSPKDPSLGSTAPTATTGPAVAGANTGGRLARKVPLTVLVRAQLPPVHRNLNLTWEPF
jgi:hypothetical protein